MPVIIIIIAIGIYTVPTVVYLVVVDDAVEYLQLIKQHVRLSISHVWHNIQTHHYRVMLSMSAAYAVAISLSVCLSVRPSVCLSHAGILSKRLNISSNFYHLRAATSR